MALSGGAAAVQGFPAGAILLSHRPDAVALPVAGLAQHRRRGADGAAVRPAMWPCWPARAACRWSSAWMAIPPSPVDEAVLDADAGLLVTSPVGGHAVAAMPGGWWRPMASASWPQAALPASPRSPPAASAIEVHDQCRRSRRRARRGAGGLRRRRADAHRVPLPRPRPVADRGRADTPPIAALLDKLGGKPAIIRTLDVGGDKPLPGIWASRRRANPFLGLRGIRLCLARPELFKPQVRALLRAAPGRALRVMLPMVATSGEIARTRGDLRRLPRPSLQREGMPAAHAAAGHHGGDAGRRHRHRPARRRLLSPSAATISPSTSWPRRATPAAAVAALNDPRHPGRAQADRPGRAPWPATAASRSASAATWPRDPACWPPAGGGPAHASRWRRRRWAGSSWRCPSSAAAMADAATPPSRADQIARLQVAAAHGHRAPAVGPARPAGHGAGQAQELRLADHQPAYAVPIPADRPDDDLRDLPSLGRRARAVPDALSQRPSRSRAAVRCGRRTPRTNCASPCRSSEPSPRRGRSRR